MYRLPRHFSAISALALVFSNAAVSPVFAQDSGGQAAADDAATSNGEEIIVVGTSGDGRAHKDYAGAVTTLNADSIAHAVPTSTADLFKTIPGVASESSGGKNGANVFVRGYPSGGDAEFVTITSEGVPIFSPATLSFLENSQLIGVDETIARVEAVRGGTGALFENGQPGLTINFVQREGGDEFEGLIKGTVADFGDVRGDFRLSGPLNDTTTFMVGGYYTSGHGIRNPGFNAEEGGQITANIRHDLEKGSLLVFARYMNDFGQWLLPIPVVRNGNKISQFGNIDPGKGTLQSRETRLSILPDGSKADLKDGRGAKLINVGTNFDYELADALKLRYRASYLDGDGDTTGQVPSSTAMTAAAYAASLGGTIINGSNLTYVNGGTVVPNQASQQVILAGIWRVRKQIKDFTNDVNLEWKAGTNTLTGGLYYADFSSNDQWNLGNAQLLTAENNPRRLNLVLDDGRIVTDKGFAGGSFFNVNAGYDGREYALYGVDEFQITPALRLDGGLRYQNYKATGTLENNDFSVDIDGNPFTLYNNGTARLNGTFTQFSYKKSRLSYTAGVNYDVTRSLSVYVRYNRGNTNPFFDNLRSGINVSPQVDNYEGGVKLRTDIMSLYATVFRTDFSGLASTVITNGAPIPSVGDARSTGAEFESALHPFNHFTVSFSGTYLNAKYRNFFTKDKLRDANGSPILDAMGNEIPIAVDQSGNRVQRQPRYQFRISPSYDFEFGDAGKFSIFSTFSYIGNRFSDVQNQQSLPHYYKIDGGVTLDLNKALQLGVTVDNLTDKVGLTEGDPRQLGQQGGQVLNARPILGRSFRFSVGYKF